MISASRFPANMSEDTRSLPRRQSLPLVLLFALGLCLATGLTYSACVDPPLWAIVVALVLAVAIFVCAFVVQKRKSWLSQTTKFGL